VLAILLFLRSVFAAALLLITAGLSITWTLGMMGWTGIPLNLLCAMLPSLVLLVGSAEDVHMIATYFRGLSQTQVEHRTFAARFMMNHLGVTLILTGLTITLAFASSIFSSIALIRDFALAASLRSCRRVSLPCCSSQWFSQSWGRAAQDSSGIQRGWRSARTPRSGVRLCQTPSSASAPGRYRYPVCLLRVPALELYVTNDPLSYLKQITPSSGTPSESTGIFPA